VKRHELDVISLVSGLLFAGLGVIFALNAVGTFDFDVRVVPATVLIVLGIAGISASVVRTSRSARPDRLESDREPDHEPDRETESVTTDRTPEE
jgi:hypothetical protein